MSSISLLPVAPWPLLLLLAAAAALLVWWPAGRRERTETVAARIRRTALVALLLVAALRPALPGTDVRVDASAVDVYFVVDTTTSVMARDYDGGRPRLEGVRADVKGIGGQLPGARFTVMTFDLDTTTRLPLTSDASALGAAADTLRPETSRWSRGSSVTVARTDLVGALQRGQAAHPERARVVFYLGDGEQTAAGKPQPFEVPSGLINGGAVLGYGTSSGGPMATTGALADGDVVDPTTGRAAISVIDEGQLSAIADELGVPYLHRTSDDSARAIVDAVHLTDLGSVRGAEETQLGGRTELYWLALLAVALLAAWELGAALASATALRRAGSRTTAPRMRPRLRRRPSVGVEAMKAGRARETGGIPPSVLADFTTAPVHETSEGRR